MKNRVFSLAMLSGSMDDAIIIPFLDGLVEAGYQGVCPHPRNGLKVPYPSRLYWQRLARFIELAQARGLEIWHYDEFPYPSGQLGGVLVEDHPHLASQTLALETITAAPDANGFIDIGRGTLVALARCRLDDKSTFKAIHDVTADTGMHLDSWICNEAHNLGYTATTHIHREDHERAFPKRISRYYAPETPLQDNEILIAIKATPGNANYQGLHKPDLTRPEVTQFFADHIYTQLSQIGAAHHLANTPIFQDEVTFYSSFPWNEEIHQTLRSQWGQEFAGNLLALFNTNIHGWENARFQYRTLCADLLEKNWYITIKEHCHRHQLQMTGHLPGEETFGGHAQIIGNAFKNLRHFDIPGYDIISSTLPDDIDRCHATGIKLVQSAAWIDGRKPTMAEAFGANGFHQDLQRNRTVLAWLGVHDIKQICDHATFSDSRSLTKYDAPPIHNRFNPMHKGAPDLWKWFQWFCDLMDQYQFDPQTLVLFPFDALTLFTLQEKQWKAQTSLLESFFHYLCAYSLDCVFLPSHQLPEVKATADGFIFQGHHFSHFIIPPFSSLHKSTFEALQQWQQLPGFCWVLPEDTTGITLFGEDHPKSTFIPITAAQIKNCSEDELVKTGANWFADMLDSPLHQWQSPRSVIKSLRINPQNQEKLLVIINPHDDPIEITAPYFGAPLPQPPEHCAMEIITEKDISKVLLAPRATAIFRHQKSTSIKINSPTYRTITPEKCQWRIAGDNFWNVKKGNLHLESHTQIPFATKAVSALWTLTPNATHPQFDYHPLPRQLKLEATFPLHLNTIIPSLSLILDLDSMPRGARWFWDEYELPHTIRDIFETQNNVYDIPTSLLTAGAHQLHMSATIENGAQGILERPILQGDFVIAGEYPLHLDRRSHQWQDAKSTFPHWREVGFPEAFGPAEYSCDFIIPDLTTGNILLELPSCIGIAKITLNGQNVGRNNWEPRLIPLPKVLLHDGRNTVQITLHGSWNNIFSRLNYRENGLHQMPVLRVHTP